MTERESIVTHNNREKILFVIDFFKSPYSGTEHQLFQLIKGLDRNRYEPQLLVFRDSEFLRENSFPCRYEVLGYTSKGSPSAWIALAKKARKYHSSGIRLAHVFFNDASVLCPPLFRLFGIKTIISRRDMGYWFSGAFRFLLPFTGRFVSAVVANSQAVKSITNAREKIPCRRIEVIYNGYAEKTSSKISASGIKESLLIPKEAVVAILVANIRPIKRIEDAVRALGVLAMDSPPVHLIVVGDGESSSLMQLAKTEGIDDRIHFVGAQSNVDEWLEAADIGILTSESEGFSNALVEYMQFRLPVICSDAGGNPEAVKHGENGLLFKVGETRELASHVSRLAQSPELRKSMGERGASLVNERFGLRSMVAQHEVLYERILGGREA